METKHIEKMLIPSYLVDSQQRLRPSSFMCIAQEMAMRAADALNFGFDDLAAHDLAWVVSRTHLIFDRIPHFRDNIEFATWHKGVNGLYFIRDYQMNDASGRSLVRGTSSWIALNTKERSLFRSDRLAEFFDTRPQNLESAIEENACRLRADRNAELVASHCVRYSDCDFIGHANNTSYITWAMYLLPADLVNGAFPAELDINFSKETREGENIDIYRNIIESEEGITVNFEGKSSNETHYLLRLIYKKDKI